MNTKNVFLYTLAICTIYLSACDNATTTSDISKDSSTENTSTMLDTGNKMQDMQMDNGLMSSMNTMMSKMEEMKKSGDFDLDFANMMIEHHQGAIDMSQDEIKSGKDEKLKAMAQNIITMQTQEIGKLQDLVRNYKTSGMKHGDGELENSMSDMKAKMSEMQMTGNTDKDFAMMMISHHEAAIKMAKLELANGMSNELKKLAKQIISDQTKEIDDFKGWQSANK